MGENIPTVKLGSLRSMTEKELEWQREFEERLAEMNSEMFTWLTNAYRTSYRRYKPYEFNGEEEEAE